MSHVMCRMSHTMTCHVQEYMAQWTARMAAAEGDYRTSADASRSIVDQHRSSCSDAGRPGRATDSASGHFAPWIAEAIEVLQLASDDRGAKAADAIREQLMERDQYVPAWFCCLYELSNALVMPAALMASCCHFADDALLWCLLLRTPASSLAGSCCAA